MPKALKQCKIVSHLLWADDLILLALDPLTLQKQLDALDSFRIEWGIDFNVLKTKVMRFNSKYGQRQPESFKIGNHPIKETNTYCYLGIEIHNSGSFAPARVELKEKAMRALYGLKSTVKNANYHSDRSQHCLIVS